MRKISRDMIRKLSIEKLNYGSGYLVTFNYEVDTNITDSSPIYSSRTKKVAVDSLEEALSLFKEDKQ